MLFSWHEPDRNDIEFQGVCWGNADLRRYPAVRDSAVQDSRDYLNVTSEHLAKEADRLKNDPIFNKALEDIRADALNSLVTADADNKTLIIRLQQVAAVTEEIRNVLDRYITAADVQENTGSFA